MSAGLRIPAAKLKRVTVDGDRAELRLRNGATYGFRKLAGIWRVDT